ncbi:MAG: MgtC/SapB family protein [Catenulisporales bacterium]|nr:MgtC/SapB family protein [Catenulisporales bacterium]
MHALGAVLLTAAQQSENIKIPSHWDAVGRISLAWVLTFALGFERQLRGAMAGDRTFSLLGAATALIGVLAGNGANTILAGAVTGIGFIGGGLCFRQTVEEHEVLHGITTAASIFACAAIGAGCGLGLTKEAIAATVATLLTLELRHIPVACCCWTTTSTSTSSSATAQAKAKAPRRMPGRRRRWRRRLSRTPARRC